MDPSLYYLIDTTKQRMLVMDKLDAAAAERFRNLRPIPNNVVIIGNKSGISSLLAKVSISSLFSFAVH